MSTGEKFSLAFILLLAAAFFYLMWKENRQRTLDRQIAQFLADLGEDELESAVLSLI